MLRERPIVRTRTRMHILRRRRRWDAVSWWFSLLFVIPVALLAGDQMLDFSPGGSSSRSFVLRVTDAFTGEALAGVDVKVGDQSATSDENGEVKLDIPVNPSPITVLAPDHEAMHGQIGGEMSSQQAVALRPTTLRGTLKDEASGAPIPGATVAAIGGSGPIAAAATTGDDGSFALRNVPDGARLRIDAGDHGTHEEDIGQRVQVDLAMRSTVVSGIVADASGQPLPGARVASGEAATESGDDGSFRLVGAPQTGDVTVSAGGFRDATLPIPENRQLSVALETDPDEVEQTAQDDDGDDEESTAAGEDLPTIKAVYVSANTAANPDELDRLIALIDETELNAVVLDIKEDYVFYDTDVAFFRDADAVDARYDAAELLKTLHDRDIYVIARLVVFKDPIVAEHRQDLAVQNEQTGDTWRDLNGAAWVNPFEEELWQANLDLAIEAATLGFDEIQYDYIRFPSDGDLTTADFGREYTEESRVGAIVDFLEMSHGAINDAGALFAIDVFGIVALYDDDQGIGQKLRDIAPYADIICPMVYPSHFDASSIDVGGVPNDFPYDVIAISMELAKAKMPDMERKLRPWLQDFSLNGMSDYDADEVRAQIDAADEAGTSGWMIWDPSNQYSDGAFTPRS